MEDEMTDRQVTHYVGDGCDGGHYVDQFGPRISLREQRDERYAAARDRAEEIKARIAAKREAEENTP